jgi:hypothetical protein
MPYSRNVVEYICTVPMTTEGDNIVSTDILNQWGFPWLNEETRQSKIQFVRKIKEGSVTDQKFHRIRIGQCR